MKTLDVFIENEVRPQPPSHNLRYSGFITWDQQRLKGVEKFVLQVIQTIGFGYPVLVFKD